MPCFGRKFEWQTAGDALALDLDEARTFTPDIRAAVAIPFARVLDGDFACAILDYKAAASLA